MTESIPAAGAGATGPRKVLLLTASVGTGHNQAARAIQADLQGEANLDVKCMDVLDYAGRYFRLKYAQGYTLCVTRFPTFYGWGYALMDRPVGPGRSLPERWRLLRERRALAGLVQALAEDPPDLIVHTHFLAPPVLQRAMAEKRLPSIPQWVVVTDTYAHRWWYCPDIERWFLPQESTAEALRRWGVEASSYCVSGMPLQAKWHEGVGPREELCRRLRLPADRPIVLVTGGAEFTCGPVLKIARGLARKHPEACIVALAGRNKKLLQQLSALTRAYPDSIVPMGFTDRMHELSAVASVLVTKPGGVITAESFAMGTPMVFLHPVPGQESHNAAFCQGQQAGVISRNSAQAVAQVCALLEDPSRLVQMSAAARRLYHPGRQVVGGAIRSRVGLSSPAGSPASTEAD